MCVFFVAVYVVNMIIIRDYSENCEYLWHVPHLVFRIWNKCLLFFLWRVLLSYFGTKGEIFNCVNKKRYLKQCRGNIKQNMFNAEHTMYGEKN